MGKMQLWDATTGHGLTQFAEHRKRAWSVSFSQVDPTNLASGSDDGSVKIWSINEVCLSCWYYTSMNTPNIMESGYATYISISYIRFQGPNSRSERST